MKLLFISVGKAHDPSLRDAIDDFTGRISHTLTTEWFLVPGSDKDSESEKILKHLKPEDRVILLDERGKEWSSPQLAEALQKEMNAGTKRLVFIIGGAYGVNQDVQARAHAIWSLSKLVFPHQLVRLILAEQVYRAITIIRGEKYHHQ